MHFAFTQPAGANDKPVSTKSLDATRDDADGTHGGQPNQAKTGAVAQTSQQQLFEQAVKRADEEIAALNALMVKERLSTAKVMIMQQGEHPPEIVVFDSGDALATTKTLDRFPEAVRKRVTKLFDELRASTAPAQPE